MKFTVGSNGVGTSYVELSHTAIEHSIVVSIDRMSVHAGDDYSVSVVGGKTRITWINSIAVGGSEEIGSGDNVFVTYAVDV
jgi:hypothetical protein